MARKLSYEALLKKITALESELKACKERERALKSGELQYKKIFVSATDGFIILDLNGNVVEANPQACRMHGYSHAEFIKLTGNDFIHPDCHPLFDQFRKETKTRGKFHTEALDVRKDGTSFIVDVKGVQFDYQGKKHLLAIQRDITERKQIEECLRKSSRELRTLSLKLLTVQETEKKRLARELHDGFGQTLTAIRFEVANAVDEIRAHNSTAALPLLEEVVHILKHAVEEVRKVSMDLRPTVLDNAGIVATISWLCREFMKVQPHVRVRQKVTVNEQEISRPLKITMYRLLQEALTNIVKHSQASLVTISLVKKQKRIELSIRDNGKGFALDTTNYRDASVRGLGLTNMNERTILSGGVFRIESEPGAGTLIKASWPLESLQQND